MKAKNTGKIGKKFFDEDSPKIKIAGKRSGGIVRPRWKMPKFY